jgi:hypothetical protein
MSSILMAIKRALDDAGMQFVFFDDDKLFGVAQR